jgi:hypothetical protein
VIYMSLYQLLLLIIGDRIELTDQIRRPCSQPILCALCIHKPRNRWRGRPEALTWQLILQVLVVFVSVLVLRDQGSSFGITYADKSASTFLPHIPNPHTLVLSQKCRDQKLSLLDNSLRRGTYMHLVSRILESHR